MAIIPRKRTELAGDPGDKQTEILATNESRLTVTLKMQIKFSLKSRVRRVSGAEAMTSVAHPFSVETAIFSKRIFADSE
jgi:hypothetical protein